MFRVLSNGRRRVVLRQLLERQPPVTVEELVDSVITVESNVHARSEDLREEVVANLHHDHLPRLARSNVIDFDDERGWITLRMAAYALDPYLELSRTEERRRCW